MKKVIIFALLISAVSFQLNAQNNIILNINHKLGDAPFALDQVAKNNMDQDFKLTRLEYYVSEISIVHDGGKTTSIEDVWILVDAASKTQVDLGSHDITFAEKIQLHIGVDPDHNHLDPSTYPRAHPLSPKSPSMHWGWTAGYKFVVLEGNAGSGLNQSIQLHGLGDSNYFRSEINLNKEASNGSLTIDIDADYAKALEDISVSSGVIVHGEGLQAKKCLENFRDYAFSANDNSSSTIDISDINQFHVSPSPIVKGFTTITLDVDESSTSYDVAITSIDGQQLNYINNVSNNQIIDFSDFAAGLYLVHLVKDSYTVITQKVIVK